MRSQPLLDQPSEPPCAAHVSGQFMYPVGAPTLERRSRPTAEMRTSTHSRIRQWVVVAVRDPWMQWHSWGGCDSKIEGDNCHRVLDAVRNHESDRLVPAVEGRRAPATDSFVQLRIVAAHMHSDCGSPVPPVHSIPVPAPPRAGTSAKVLRMEHAHWALRLPRINLAISGRTRFGRTSESAAPARCGSNQNGPAVAGGLRAYCHG